MKTALVTGADRGLGYCLVREFLAKGYTVFAGKFLQEYSLLEALAETVPGRLFPVWMDMESRASIQAAYAQVAALTDHLDVAVSNAAYMGGPSSSAIRGELPIDTALMEKSIAVNALGAMQMAEVFLPLMDKGEGKRLCFISSEVSSVTLMRRDGDFRYCMSKTALNMGVRLLYNKLYADGYTFRLYQPGWMRRMSPDGTKQNHSDHQINPERSAATAIEVFTSHRADEQRLELVDYLGNAWPY